MAMMQVVQQQQLDIPPNLEALSRRELQTIAKAAGVRANAKSVEIIAALDAMRVPTAAPSRSATPHQNPQNGAANVAETPRPRQAASTLELDNSSTPSPPRETRERVAATDEESSQPPLQPVTGSLELIERPLPPMLTPAPCVAGTWQPLRLTGAEVELTLLVR